MLEALALICILWYSLIITVCAIGVIRMYLLLLVCISDSSALTQC